MVFHCAYFAHVNRIQNRKRFIELQDQISSIHTSLLLSYQILIASIMCGYSKEDWTELAKMAEVIHFHANLNAQNVSQQNSLR